MNATDQIKVLDAGFVIIRRDHHNLLIKHKGKGGHEWKHLEKGFKSKAALDRRMAQLLTQKQIIED